MFCQKIGWMKCVLVSILQSTFPYKIMHFNCATPEDACSLRASFCVGELMYFVFCYVFLYFRVYCQGLE
jgi:hypothetical protein